MCIKYSENRIVGEVLNPVSAGYRFSMTSVGGFTIGHRFTDIHRDYAQDDSFVLT